MAKTRTITADFRDDTGKGASRRLRRAGLVPAILYGAERPPRNIQLKHNEVFHAARDESFFSSILDLDFNGKHQKVLVRDWQVHPFRQQMLHMDFMRVRDDEAIRVSVPLHFVNAELSPAGKAADVIVSHLISEVEVECLPADLPESIQIDLSALEEGDLIHLSGIELPEGVKLTALMVEGEDHDYAVVSAQKARVHVEEEPATDEAAEGGDAAEGGEAGDAGEADDD